MIAAFDAHHTVDGQCTAAAVLFSDYGDAGPTAVHRVTLPAAADYVPGQLYRRELPGILMLLDQIDLNVKECIVDGYVMLGEKPGLGQRLYDACRCRTAVIGVAKSRFKNAAGMAVYRGASRRPLFVTSAGMDLGKASALIRAMHGNHRIPTMLKRVDRLARHRGYEHG